MSKSPGRALIISNTYHNTTQGANHDYGNIERMLDSFGFITNGGHRGYTAKVRQMKYFVCVKFTKSQTSIVTSTSYIQHLQWSRWLS